jgi:hypothetical protein
MAAARYGANLSVTPSEGNTMRNWIAGVMTVLGSLLVLAGAAVVALKAATPDSGKHDHDQVPVGRPGMEVGAAPVGLSDRVARVARRVSGADHLIAWGVLLLVLAAVTAGAISFNLGASAASK